MLDAERGSTKGSSYSLISMLIVTATLLRLAGFPAPETHRLECPDESGFAIREVCESIARIVARAWTVPRTHRRLPICK